MHQIAMEGDVHAAPCDADDDHYDVVSGASSTHSINPVVPVEKCLLAAAASAAKLMYHKIDYIWNGLLKHCCDIKLLTL